MTQRVLFGIVILLVVVSSPAWAAKKRKPEVYSAIVDEDVSAAPTIAPQPQPVRRDAFDPVPANQVDFLVKRLDLTRQLIEKHSRAYDYRVLTTKELQSILSQLEKR